MRCSIRNINYSMFANEEVDQDIREKFNLDVFDNNLRGRSQTLRNISII